MKKKFITTLILITVAVLILIIFNLSNSIVVRVQDLWNSELDFIHQLMSSPKSCLQFTLFWEHAFLAMIIAVWMIWMVIGLLVAVCVELFHRCKKTKTNKSISAKVKNTEHINSHNTITSNPRGFTRVYKE